MTRVINMDSLRLSDRRLLYANRLVGYKYIGRRGHTLGEWGNRYSHQQSVVENNPAEMVRVKDRAEAVRRHAEDVGRDPELRARIKRELQNNTLVCWCKPLACHGDTLARIADEVVEETEVGGR